jgi:hypothetical protein
MYYPLLSRRNCIARLLVFLDLVRPLLVLLADQRTPSLAKQLTLSFVVIDIDADAVIVNDECRSPAGGVLRNLELDRDNPLPCVLQPTESSVCHAFELVEVRGDDAADAYHGVLVFWQSHHGLLTAIMTGRTVSIIGHVR